MKNPWDIILEIEADNSRLVKEAIIAAAAKEENDVFFKGAQYALDALLTFGVKKVPVHESADGPGLSWDEFVVLADKLKNRELTGHAARDAVFDAMTKSTQNQWNNWYRRILIKDLRCGAGEKSFNKSKKYEKYTIPVFSCQLAHDSANHESKVSGKKLIECKLDGVRLLTIVYPNGKVDQFSRNGKEMLNFEHIKQQFKSIARYLAMPYVFDGEIMSSSFQDLMKQVHRKENINTTDAVLNLFDIIPLYDFQSGICKIPQQERSDILRNWFDGVGHIMKNVNVLDQELVDLNTIDGKALFNEINKKAIEQGFEGIMLKDPTAPYELKRSVAWLKIKPYIEVTLRIKRCEEGTGRNEGKLGAFVCEGIEDDKHIESNVGSGFSDKQREEYWQNRFEITDNLAEVRADAITKNQDGTYSLRFPRFLTFRGFKQGEKI